MIRISERLIKVKAHYWGLFETRSDRLSENEAWIVLYADNGVRLG